MLRLGLATAAVTLVVDQATKLYFYDLLVTRGIGYVEVVPNFNLVRVWNYGVSFGMFNTDASVGRWVFVGVALAIVVALLTWLRRAGTRLIAPGSPGAPRNAGCAGNAGCGPGKVRGARPGGTPVRAGIDPCPDGPPGALLGTPLGTPLGSDPPPGWPGKAAGRGGPWPGPPGDGVRLGVRCWPGRCCCCSGPCCRPGRCGSRPGWRCRFGRCCRPGC